MTASQAARDLCLVFGLFALLQSSWAQGAEATPSFRATSGVCGRVFFVKKIAADYQSAMLEMQRGVSASDPRSPCAGKAGCRLESFEIGVEGNPGTHFYALKLVDTQTGKQAAGVGQVISSDGRLFGIHWCPD